MLLPLLGTSTGFCGTKVNVNNRNNNGTQPKTEQVVNNRTVQNGKPTGNQQKDNQKECNCKQCQKQFGTQNHGKTRK